MLDICNKKKFYSMMLRDRFPLAKIDFPTECGEGSVEFFRTPLGVVLCASVSGAGRLREIKMYNKKRSEFDIQNIFCGDNLIEISKGVFAGLSTKLRIEDAIGRDFLIKLDDMSIMARAQMLPKRESTVDKTVSLVYN